MAPLRSPASPPAPTPPVRPRTPREPESMPVPRREWEPRPAGSRLASTSLPRATAHSPRRAGYRASSLGHAMHNASPDGAIPPSRSHQGPIRRLTSARESGSKSTPEGTPRTRGRLRALGWDLGTGQCPPSRWTGPLPAAAAGLPVLAAEGPAALAYRPASPPRASLHLEPTASQRSYSGAIRTRLD